MEYKIIIPGRLPALNEMIDEARGNRYKNAGSKKRYTLLCSTIIKQHKIPKLTKKVDVFVTWYEKDKRRDPDNIACGMKYFMDGLMLANIIDNDGHNQIGDIHNHFKVDCTKSRIEIILKEVD